MTESTLAPDVQARVEQLLRDAHLQRMRQQWAAAETLCRQALELSPEDPLGMEMLGDLLSEKGSLEPALDSYRKAFARQPQKAALEEKIARLVLRKGEEERERLEAELMLSSPSGNAARKRNATLAILLSVLCPGGGQLFNGEHVKGGILLAVGLVALAFGAPDLLKMFLGLIGPLPRGQSIDGMRAALGILAGLIWLYSILDAAAQAGKGNKKTGG
jgi:tetratricopeptide (TPR) repeat protein